MLKWTRNSHKIRKGMSSSTKKGVAPVSPVVGYKPSPSTSTPKLPNNGSGPPPLNYQSEPKDDVNMNEVIEENIELEVILPDGTSVSNVVDHSMPMLDLLIQLAVKNKFNPSNYTLVVYSDETGRPIDYKANQTIGTIESQTVRLVPKKTEIERYPGKSKVKSQPFEMTYRFTVNLPRNQKMVLRVSPAMTLQELFFKVCEEKALDPSVHSLQHIKDTNMPLDMKTMTIGDLKSHEVNFVSHSNGMLDNGGPVQSDIRVSTENIKMPGEPQKKKRGFLSFLKKDKKLKISEADHQSTSKIESKPLTPPAERKHMDASQSARPKSMFVTSSEFQNGEIAHTSEKTLPKAPPRTGKKRQAPLPPTQKAPQTLTVDVVIEDKSHQKDVRKSDSVPERLHSRNSSDSSGYHEPTLSGAESPDAERVKSSVKTSIDTTSIESVNESSEMTSDVSKMNPGDSQTLPLNRTIPKPPRQRAQSLERKTNTTLSTVPVPTQPVKPSAKKKRAPAPPQPNVSMSAPSALKDGSTSHKTSDAHVEVITEEVKVNHNQDEGLDNVDNTVDQVTQDTSNHEQDDVDASQKSQRPCSFIAPPPPVEPPPDFSPQVEKHFVDKGVVVNEDNASLFNGSQKGSPTSTHSRVSSVSSSVCTIEDVCKDFDMAIALGEMSLTDKPEYGSKSEMAMFVERMSKLTTNQIVGEPADHSDSTSVQDTEDSETGSVIHHGSEHSETVQHTDTESVTESELSTQSDQDRKEKERQARLSAIFSDQYDESWNEPSSPPKLGNDSKTIGRAINQKLLSPDSEDALTFDIPPPEEFRNETVIQELKYDDIQIEEPKKSSVVPLEVPYSQHSEYETSTFTQSPQQVPIAEPEDEEEWSETIEEVYHFGPSSSYTFGGAVRKIPDFETKKEPESPKSISNQSLKTFTYYHEPESKHIKEQKQTDKEEFVLTTEDLKKINFIASPPMKNRNRGSYVQGKSASYNEPQREQPSTQTTSRYNNSYDEPEVTTQSYRESPIHEEKVYTSSTKLNMYAPRDLTPSGWMSKSSIDVESSVPEPQYIVEDIKRPQVAAATYSRLLTPSGWQTGSSTCSQDSRSEASTPPSVGEHSDDSKTAQYEQLEEQLKQWQEQLEMNQEILASQQFTPENQVIQEQMQAQIEMQKQMMDQLKKSMLALSQGMESSSPVRAEQSPMTATSAEPVNHPPSPPPVQVPPSPPPAPQVQLKKVTSNPRPVSKRFEPKLDPREELMIAIRSFGGRGGLSSVPLQKTNWKP